MLPLKRVIKNFCVNFYNYLQLYFFVIKSLKKGAIMKDIYKYNIRYDEVDMDDTLKPVALMNFLQDVASLNANEKDFGSDFVFSHGLAWFVLKYRVEIYDYDKNIKELVVKTCSRGAAKLFAYRDFDVFQGEKLIARATSQWGLVDFNSKKMLSPLETFKNIPQYEKREDDLKFDKIPDVTNPATTREFVVGYDDLDVNKHVNNVRYLHWALETLDYDFRKTHEINTIDIYYKKEISFGGCVVSETEFDETKTQSLHRIKNADTDETLCSIKIGWLKLL